MERETETCGMGREKYDRVPGRTRRSKADGRVWNPEQRAAWERSERNASREAPLTSTCGRFGGSG